MTYDGEEHVSLLTYPEIRDRLILLNGFSKTWAMTGWRLGWSIWPAALYDKVRKLAVNCWSCVNAPTQYRRHRRHRRSAGRRRRAWWPPSTAAAKVVTELLNTLPGVSCITPKGAFYAFPERLEDRLAGEAARQRAARRCRRGADRRAGFRRERRGLHPRLLCQFGGEHPQGDGADRRLPRPAQCDRCRPARRQ